MKFINWERKGNFNDMPVAGPSIHNTLKWHVWRCTHISGNDGQETRVIYRGCR